MIRLNIRKGYFNSLSYLNPILKRRAADLVISGSLSAQK